MEQSKGEITAEQVERAIAKPRNIDYRELPRVWREWAPDYVIAAQAAEDREAHAHQRMADIAESERPTPRFKVGEWVRVHNHASTHYGTVYRIAEVSDIYYRKTVGSGVCSYSEENLEPASPPAPEVVDVPQPRIVVKRCDEVEAEWTSADATILIVTHDALDDAIFVPIALLRAMLADIDAQQGGAS